MLPSLFLVFVPYQSTLERLVTLAQMCVVYEGLVSMGQERLTVRYGATKMYHTILQNMIIQAFIVVLVSRGDNSLEVNQGTLAFAILTTFCQATTTLHVLDKQQQRNHSFIIRRLLPTSHFITTKQISPHIAHNE
jgi:hypothetical protein